MTPRGTAALLLVLTALLAYLYLHDGTTTPAVVAEPAPLLDVSPDAVGRLEFEDAEGRLTLVRSPDGWADATGRPVRSNAPTDLLAALATLRPVAVVAATPAAVDEFGLGHDAARLRVIDRTEHPLLALEIGRRNPAWTGLYARRAGEQPVILVGAQLGWELKKLRTAAAAPADTATP